MAGRVGARLDDIATRISSIERLLAGRTIAEARQDEVTVAALERFLDIISEASRNLPEDMKGARPEIPWRRIADLGNRIRHAYQHVDFELLWAIYADDVEPLKQAIAALSTRSDGS